MGKCKVITDEMMMIASEALSECLSFEDINERGIFPKFEKIREISLHIACKVIIAAVK
jgi:malic enzyme